MPTSLKPFLNASPSHSRAFCSCPAAGRVGYGRSVPAQQEARERYFLAFHIAVAAEIDECHVAFAAVLDQPVLRSGYFRGGGLIVDQQSQVVVIQAAARG